MLSLRAFLRLEAQRFKNGISWFESKIKIHRVAATAYLSKQKYKLNFFDIKKIIKKRYLEPTNS